MNVRRALIVFAASLLVAAGCASTKKPGDCPPPRQIQPDQVCNQVEVWAKDPKTGACCHYATPCNAPEGWETYGQEADCRAASR